MKLRVHRAICGERNRAHSVLTSSVLEEAAIRFLPSVTDLPLNCPSGQSWQPFIRGFAHGTWYVFTKTFPDPMAPRPGMVRTYVLLLDVNDVGSVVDLSPILSLFPHQIDASWSAHVSEEAVDATTETTSSDTPGFAALVRALLQSSPNETVIWIGQEGYNEVSTALWRSLWPAARRRLVLDFCFLPTSPKPTIFGVIAVPKELANRWTDYPRVGNASTNPTDISPAEAFLRGLPQGEPIRELIRDLGSAPPGFADLRRTEFCAEVLGRLPGAAAGELRSLVEFLIRLAPIPQQGSHLKEKVVEALTRKTTTGSQDDILGLRNLYGLKIPGAGDKANEAIVNWLEAVVPDATRADESRTVLLEAIRKPDSPWSTTVLKSLGTLLTRWRSEFARSVWAWWQAATDLVEKIGDLLSGSPFVERSLVDDCPSSVGAGLAQSLRDFALKRDWFTLHAAVCSAAYEPYEAFVTHLSADRRMDNEEAVVFLVQRVPLDTTVQTALSTGDERVLRAAGRICAARPDLLRPLKIEDRFWRFLLTETLIAEFHVWGLLDNVQQLRDSLLDLLLSGEVMPPKLFEQISKTAGANLIDYHNRRKIWTALPQGMCGAFLEATAVDWVTRFQATPGLDADVETQLESAILSPVGREKLLDPRQKNAPHVGLATFRHFSRLDEAAFCSWLRALAQAHVHLPPNVADDIGRLTVSRKWADAAETLTDLSDHHVDFAPAARASLELLGFVRRFFARRKLGESALPPDDFWKAFDGVAVELYQRGPTEKSMWNRAGGKDSDLPTEKAGRVQWTEATHLLRHGGGGKKISVHTVLATMRSDYPRNPQLRELQECVKHMRLNTDE